MREPLIKLSEDPRSLASRGAGVTDGAREKLRAKKK